jgi:hypothetical protein
MRHIKIGSLTLLAGGTRLEREEEMGECQSTACFIEAAIRDTQTHDSGVLLTQLRTAPRFALSEVQLIGGKSMAEQLLSALLMERQELPTVLDMARQAAFRMAPKPGRVVLSAVLSITASVEVDVGLEAVEEVAHTILQGISEDENIDFVLGGMERSDKGASFVLATAERLVKEGTP